MKVGIIGLPQTGKKTLFQVLTGNAVPEQADLHKPLPGVCAILDGRFERLVGMYAPRKQVPAKIELELLPRLERETIARGQVFRDIADVDAVCHVVRAFSDETIYHVDGSIDPLRDIEAIDAELLLHDLLFVETRLERIAESLKKLKDERQQRERELLEKLRQHLEAEQPLRLLPLDPDEDLLIRSYPFITRKEMVLALNVDESALGDTSLLESFADMCAAQRMKAMQVCAQVESEIVMLESAAERREFMQELGIRESALEQLGRLCIEALGLISFFTVGSDEVRQWLVRQGSTAPQAAGVIHSDLERGFIRAETMRYADLVAHGSEAELKSAGKVYLKGRDYTVADGDILNIRFKV